MHTKDVTIDQVKIDDHFFLGGRLYQVTNIEPLFGAIPNIRIEFNSPQFMPSMIHHLDMDPGFTMQVIRYP